MILQTFAHNQIAKHLMRRQSHSVTILLQTLTQMQKRLHITSVSQCTLHTHMYSIITIIIVITYRVPTTIMRMRIGGTESLFGLLSFFWSSLVV